MAKRTGKRSQNPSDWHLWGDVKRSVNPLRRAQTIVPDSAVSKVVSPPPDAFANTRSPGEQPRFFSPPWSPKKIGPGPGNPMEVAGRLEPRLHRRVRRGQVPIDAEVDLHGLHQEQAHQMLFEFVVAHARRGDRTILVITGKGQRKSGPGTIAQRGVLRHMLPRWLNEPAFKPYIAGWELSASHHGGEGACYVRLKRMTS